MSAMRPLPSRPSLDYDRKQAKQLLRDLRAGAAEAWERARAQHPAITESFPDAILADAQLVVAREYGFASWPRMVQYIDSAYRRSFRNIRFKSPESYRAQVRSLLAQHAARHPWGGRVLAAFVPRFYGMSVNEVFDNAITEADACLAVARGANAASWEALLDKAVNRGPELHRSATENQPWQQAARAIRENNLESLQAVVAAHPAVLNPPSNIEAAGATLPNFLIEAEQTVGQNALRPIAQWLSDVGFDLSAALNQKLCQGPRPDISDVEYWLDRGADPNWVAPNGVSVLQHALLTYWNGDAVDLIAAHVVAPNALWIAAGLGDVNGVSRFLDRNGLPTRAARQQRPPFDAVGIVTMPMLPEPDDEELLHEAFWVAALNGRVNVIEYMASRGLNLDCNCWGAPVVNIAVGNLWTPVAECLVRLGANLDIRSTNDSNGSAREMARNLFLGGAHDPEPYRHMAERCGMDPDTLLAEHQAKSSPQSS